MVSSNPNQKNAIRVFPISLRNRSVTSRTACKVPTRSPSVPDKVPVQLNDGDLFFAASRKVGVVESTSPSVLGQTLVRFDDGDRVVTASRRVGTVESTRTAKPGKVRVRFDAGGLMDVFTNRLYHETCLGLEEGEASVQALQALLNDSFRGGMYVGHTWDRTAWPIEPLARLADGLRCPLMWKCFACRFQTLRDLLQLVDHMKSTGVSLEAVCAFFGQLDSPLRAKLLQVVSSELQNYSANEEVIQMEMRKLCQDKQYVYEMMHTFRLPYTCCEDCSDGLIRFGESCRPHRALGFVGRAECDVHIRNMMQFLLSLGLVSTETLSNGYGCFEGMVIATNVHAKLAEARLAVLVVCRAAVMGPATRAIFRNIVLQFLGVFSVYGGGDIGN